MISRRARLLAVFLVLVFIPFLAFAERTKMRGTPEGECKEKTMKKICVVSKDGCETTTTEGIEAMLPEAEMESCCGGPCMQLAERMCGGAGPMNRMMSIGGPGCMSGGMMEMCGGPCGGASCAQGILDMEDELTLTDEQQHELREIGHAAALSMLDLETALAKERLVLEKLLGDEAGLEEIARQLDSVSGAESKLRLEEISSEREAMNVLTKDQRAALKAHKGQRMLKWMAKGDPSCREQIEVNVEKGAKPGERKVIIIKNPDSGTDE